MRLMFFAGSIAFFAIPVTGLVVSEILSRGKKYVTSIISGCTYP